MTWFRVDTEMPRSDAVHVLAETLGIRRNAEALGLYVGCLAGFAENQPDGNVAATTDTSLEEWAGWRGKRGEFARAFRRRCVSDGSNGKDPAGTIRGWYRNRKLIEKQIRDRLKPDGRKRSAEEEDDDDPPGIPRKSPPVHDGQRDGTETEDSSGRSPGRRLEDRARVEVGGDQVLEFLDNLPEGEKRASWAPVLQGFLDGLGLAQGRAASMGELAAACIDYRKDDPPKWGVPHFRGYVNRIISSARRAPRAAGERPPAGNYDRALEEARRREGHGHGSA